MPAIEERAMTEAEWQLFVAANLVAAASPNPAAAGEAASPVFEGVGEVGD